MEFDEVSEKWVVEALDQIKVEFNLASDAALAKFLQTTPAMINQVRGGRTAPSGKLKFVIADKLGWLKTVKGVAWVTSQILGGEIGENMKKTIIGVASSQANKANDN